jgi:aryl-alcohol dehydrogenase-like predicted oxidoreductase
MSAAPPEGDDMNPIPTDDARRAFDRTLSELGSDYVDLFLIQWPLPTLYGGDFVTTWQTLEAFHRDGRALSIGVSNLDFQLEPADVIAIDALDRGEAARRGAHPGTFAYIPTEARGPS